MRNIPLQKIANALGVVFEGDLQVSGYQIDSTRIGPGELFFAIEGKKVDGHQFLGDVKSRGGVAAVVSGSYYGPDYGLVLLRVENVVESLQDLARVFMREFKGMIVAVTGSLGKTTVKEFIATLLEGKFKVGKTYLNYNTKLTYPITLLNRTGEEEVMVVEMGMTEPGDIDRLLGIAAPDVAVVTKIAWVHAANFPNGIADIAWEKGRIFAHPKVKKAVFSHELYGYPEVIEAIQGEKVSFSLEERSADYFLSQSEGKYLVDERGVRAYEFDPPYKQTHVLHNFLAAVSVARVLKMEWDEINRQVAKLALPKMRFEQFEREGIVFINDAYNANPDSMKAALSHLPVPKEGGKRIAVLGMMIDMGANSVEIHRDVGRFAQKSIDHLLVLGSDATGIYEGFQEVQKPAEQFADLSSLSSRLKELMRPGDVVLVKASRCVKLETIFERLD